MQHFTLGLVMQGLIQLLSHGNQFPEALYTLLELVWRPHDVWRSARPLHDRVAVVPNRFHFVIRLTVHCGTFSSEEGAPFTALWPWKWVELLNPMTWMWVNTFGNSVHFHVAGSSCWSPQQSGRQQVAAITISSWWDGFIWTVFFSFYFGEAHFRIPFNH